MTQSMSRRRVLQGLGMLGLGGVARSTGARTTVPQPSSLPAVSPAPPGTAGFARPHPCPWIVPSMRGGGGKHCAGSGRFLQDPFRSLSRNSGFPVR